MRSPHHLPTFFRRLPLSRAFSRLLTPSRAFLLGSTSKDFPKLFPIGPILGRRFTTAKSQAKLNQLWLPPRMFIGELYANTLKTCSLGLAYGPIYPACYLLTAAALLFSNICTSYSISRWYVDPARRQSRVSFYAL